jgi:hypothetical protein
MLRRAALPLPSDQTGRNKIGDTLACLEPAGAGLEESPLQPRLGLALDP